MENVLLNFCQYLNLPHDEHERLREVIQRHGGVNWRDALGKSQIISKLEVISVLKQSLKGNETLAIIGGWVGLIPYLMNRNEISCRRVVNIEIDQNALAASEALNSEISFPFELIFEDAVKVNYKQWPLLTVINTSSEHLGNYAEWISQIPSGTSCILQNNNMFNLSEHVNCFESVDEFASASGLMSLQLKTEFDLGDGWKRFMVVGMK